MIKRGFHISLRLIALSSILLTIAIGGFFAWVITGPRSLDVLSVYIEEELSNLSPKYNVRMNESFIAWDKDQKAVSIYITGTKILNNKNDIIANLPEIYFDISTFRILQGNILSSDVSFIKPDFRLDTTYEKQAKDTNISLSDKEAIKAFQKRYITL